MTPSELADVEEVAKMDPVATIRGRGRRITLLSEQAFTASTDELERLGMCVRVRYPVSNDVQPLRLRKTRYSGQTWREPR